MPTNPPVREGARPAFVYALIALAVLILLIGGVTIWSMTDNSGTNVLSGDPQSTSPPAPLTTP